jgi:hypothetical protein
MTPTTKKILTRHNCASPREFAYYAARYPMRHLKQMLNRSERTIRDWLAGNKVIPPWAVAVLRLQALEYELRLDHMGYERPQYELEVIDPRQAPAANDSRYEEVAAMQPHASTAKTRPAPAARTPGTGQAARRHVAQCQTRSSRRPPGRRSECDQPAYAPARPRHGLSSRAFPSVGASRSPSSCIWPATLRASATRSSAGRANKAPPTAEGELPIPAMNGQSATEARSSTILSRVTRFGP